jgi:hypothetical protein
MADVHALHDRYVEALNRRDWEALRALMTPDYYEDWPQSGERIVGVENFRQIFENYPGAATGPLAQTSRVFAGAERWAITPLFTTVRVSGGDELFTSVSQALYPNDEIWFIVSIVELRDGLMAKATRYWAPTYPAPEWRSGWTAPIPSEDAQRAP